jgi:hypothetical protein
MKKSTCIQLVLITAALAACNKPMYQQQDYDPGYYEAGDPPDSTNSCPIELSAMPPDYYNWLYCFRPYGTITLEPNIIGFYAYQPLRHVTRAGFGVYGAKVGTAIS